MPILKNVGRTFWYRTIDASGSGVAGTPTIKVSTGGATAAASTNAPTSVPSLGVGCGRITLTAAETNADDFAFLVHLDGAVEIFQAGYPEGDYTTTRAGKIDRLDSNVSDPKTLAANQDVRNVTGSLAAAERVALADAVALELITPDDGQQVIQAIVNAINAADVGLQNLTTATIAAAVKALLEGSGSFLALIKAKTDLVQFDGSGFVKAVEQHPLTDYQQRGVAATLPTTAPATWRAVLAAIQPDYAPAKPNDLVVNPSLTAGQATTLANLDSMMESSGVGGHERFRASALEQAPAGGGGGGGYTPDDRARDARVAAEVGAIGALPVTLPTLNGAGSEISVRRGTARTILRGDPLARFEIQQDLTGAAMELHDATDGIVSTAIPEPPAAPGGPWLVRFECGVSTFTHRGRRAYWVAARWAADGAEFALHERLSGTILVH